MMQGIDGEVVGTSNWVGASVGGGEVGDWEGTFVGAIVARLGSGDPSSVD